MKNTRLKLENFINTSGKIIYFGEKKLLACPYTKNMRDILQIMIKKNERVIFLTDKQDYTIKGVVVCGDICRLLRVGAMFKLGTEDLNYYHQIYKQSISSIMTRSVVQVYDHIPLSLGVQIMTTHNIGTLPLIDRNRNLSGVIRERDIAFLLAETNKKVKVRDIMSENVTSCAPNSTIYDALKITCNSGFRRLPVVHQHVLVGYLTVKDLLRYFNQKRVIELLKEGQIDQVFYEPISTIMTTPVLTIDPKASIVQFAQILKDYHIGALPVVKQNELVGIVTENDIVKAMAIAPTKIPSPPIIEVFKRYNNKNE